MSASQNTVDAHLMLVQNLAHVVAQELPWQSAYDAVEASARALAAMPARPKPLHVQVQESALLHPGSMRIGGCPFCGRGDCIAGQCRSASMPAGHILDCFLSACKDQGVNGPEMKEALASRAAPTPPTAPAQDAQGVRFERNTEALRQYGEGDEDTGDAAAYTMLKSAPERIWLNVDDCPDEAAEFPDDHEGITWCTDEIGFKDVPYIRADLAALSASSPADTREPLTDEQIAEEHLKQYGDFLSEFSAGVRFAERAHGIGVDE